MNEQINSNNLTNAFDTTDTTVTTNLNNIIEQMNYNFETIELNDEIKNLSNFTYKFKILLLGDTFVGKTCVFNKYIYDTFHPYINASTIGVDFMTKVIYVNNEFVKLQIWDMGGKEQYRTIIRSYYKNANGVILFFDKTYKYSFDSLDKWIKEIIEIDDTNKPIIVCGNKCDLNTNVEYIEIDNFISKYIKKGYNIIYLDTSAKNGHNINLVFKIIANLLLEQSKTIRYNKQLYDEQNEQFNERINMPSNYKNDKNDKNDCCCPFFNF